jgi:hypothetical protein
MLKKFILLWGKLQVNRLIAIDMTYMTTAFNDLRCNQGSHNPSRPGKTFLGEYK